MVRLGIIGGGGVGNETLHNVGNIPDAQAVAVTEPDEAARRRINAFAGKNTLPHYRVADNVHAVFVMDQEVTFSLTANHGVACDHPQVGRPVPPPLEQWTRLGHEAGFKIAGERGSIVSDDWRLTLCVNKLVENEKRGGWRLTHDHIEDFSSFRQHACIHDQEGMLAYFIRACMAGEACIEPDPDQLLNVPAASIAAEKAMAEHVAVEVERSDAGKSLR